MARVSLITYMFLLMFSCLYGAPFKHISHTGGANTDSKIISTVDCPENCSFVITESSLYDAQKDLAKFLNLKKSMLVYVNIDPHNLTLSPVNDQQKQNQMREWQWIMSTNSWYINLPIDLDYASFHVTYFGESRIRLKIEAVESNCCSISDAGIEQVRNILWSDLFTNRSGSLLCNRYFDHQEWKSTFYAFTTVWIGYDLLCIAPTIDKSYQEKSHAAASVLIPLFCFFIALYHPLTNKIIANPHTKNHLKKVKLSKGGMKLFDYLKGDKPFGYKRVVLKLFFSNKKCAKDKKLIPAIKLCILYYFIYLFFNTLPMMLEHCYDKEELEDFNRIYKFGLPVFHWIENHWKQNHWIQIHLKYKCQLFLTCLLLLPLASLANLWNFYEFVKSPDFVIFLKFPIVTDENTTAKTSNCRSYSWSLSEDVDYITAKMKKRRNGIYKNNQDQPNTTDEYEFYSKFIKRFTLLFSFEFWKHIFNLSTKITLSLESRENKELECSESSNPKPNEDTKQECSESSNPKPNEDTKQECSESSNPKPNEDIKQEYSKSSNPKPNEDNKQKSCIDVLSCICSTIVCLIGVIIVLPINFILIVLTCAFPVFWFIVYPLLNRIKMVLSILIQKCKKSEPEKSTKEQNNPTTRKKGKTEKINSTENQNIPSERNVCYQICCLLVDIVSIFFLYQQLSVIVLIIRSIVYIVFIAITNYEHLMRIVIVVTSCFTYLGMFISKFIDRYAAILKIMFDEYEKNTNETQECSTKESEKGPIFISEKCFDYVIDQCYAVREHFFFVVFKIVITIMFFSLALAVLFQSNIFDSTTRLTNILEFVFVVVTPSVFFKFCDKDTQEIIDDHKKDIIDHTNDYNNKEQEEENEECCERIYDFINYCKSNTKTNADTQTCCCLKWCQKSNKSLQDDRKDNSRIQNKQSTTQNCCCTRTKEDDGEKLRLVNMKNQ